MVEVAEEFYPGELSEETNNPSINMSKLQKGLVRGKLKTV
jgi:hypothetical protein